MSYREVMMTDYRKNQCDRLFQYLIGQGQIGMTRRQAADILGLKKSKHLTGLINELVAAGFAVEKRGSLPNGLPVSIYFPTDLAWQHVKNNPA